MKTKIVKITMKSIFATIVFYVFVVGFLNLAYDGRHSIKNGVVSPPLNQVSRTQRLQKKGLPKITGSKSRFI